MLVAVVATAIMAPFTMVAAAATGAKMAEDIIMTTTTMKEVECMMANVDEAIIIILPVKDGMKDQRYERS